ncbi:MAG: cell envelope integrity protein TolA, partial [Clostridiales bacterium]|nr:cell envelope integrity protein TolA [Clostridiales bacterium]
YDPDPDVEFNAEYGAKVTHGVLYNSYVRYNGDEYTVALNKNYQINNKTLNDYMSALSVSYDSETAVGEANTVNKIITTATLTLTDNWVLDNGEKAITLTKDWYIVTLNNALRSLDGDKTTVVEGWSFGGEVPALSIRPEHGDSAVLTLANGAEVLARFAVQYSGTGDNTVVKYYDVKAEGDGYVIDTDKELEDDYCAEQFGSLKMGAYTLNVFVPAYTSTENHEHWWDNAEPEATDVVFCAISRTYSFSVGYYEVTAENISLNEADGKDITIKLLSSRVEYNAMNNNVPEAVITFRGVELVQLVDYELISDNVKVGKASFMFVGKGTFSGTIPFNDIYDITPAVNTWKDVPSIMYWTYGNYDKQMNLINGTPTYLDNPNDISFKVTTDMMGETPVTDTLDSFVLTDGIVSDEVAGSLSALPVGTYYLFATVKGSTNYKPLIQRGVAFKVFPATNNWEVMPSIVVWTEGQFKSVNMPVAKALYGNATIVIKDGDGKDVYNNVTGVNKLSAAAAGTYTLTATVMGSNDYNGLVYSTVFIVHEKPGIPVWATVLIVLGSLLLVAIIIFVLIKTGVLRILTNKLMVNIRTQAAVDATVAAVRANKKNEEAKQYVAEVKQQEQAEAKKEERKKARRERAALQKTLPVEQKIAALEEKARKATARAEKMRERAEAIQQRADRMRETTNPEQQQAPTEQPAIEPTAEAAATETPETTTEE